MILFKLEIPYRIYCIRGIHSTNTILVNEWSLLLYLLVQFPPESNKFLSLLFIPERNAAVNHNTNAMSIYTKTKQQHYHRHRKDLRFFQGSSTRLTRNGDMT